MMIHGEISNRFEKYAMTVSTEECTVYFSCIRMADAIVACVESLNRDLTDRQDSMNAFSILALS